MAERPIYEVRRGLEAPIVIAADLGEQTSGLRCGATVHRLPGGRNSATYDPEITATYEVDYYPGDSERGPGWRLSLPATVTAGLADGIYLAKFTVTGNPDGEPLAGSEWLLSVSIR